MESELSVPMGGGLLGFTSDRKLDFYAEYI